MRAGQLRYMAQRKGRAQDKATASMSHFSEQHKRYNSNQSHLSSKSAAAVLTQPRSETGRGRAG